jgi:hypothetical protein
VLKVLRAVRKALKAWRSLPANEREQYRDHVERIRSLVAELGGAHAVGFVEGDVDRHPPDSGLAEHEAHSSRPRADVLADLQSETSRLLAALASPVAAAGKDSIPLSARMGGKLAVGGIRRAARRYGK